MVPDTHTSLTPAKFSWLPSVWPTQLLHWALKAHPGSSFNLLAALSFQQILMLLPFNPPRRSTLSMDPKSHPFHKSVTSSDSSPYHLSQAHWKLFHSWPTDCQHHIVVRLRHSKSCDPAVDFYLNLPECQSPTNEQPGPSQSVSSFLSAFLIPSLGLISCTHTPGPLHRLFLLSQSFSSAI